MSHFPLIMLIFSLNFTFRKLAQTKSQDTGKRDASFIYTLLEYRNQGAAETNGHDITGLMGLGTNFEIALNSHGTLHRIAGNCI